MTRAEVADAVSKLGSAKAAGPDGIRGKLLGDAVVRVEGCVAGATAGPAAVPLYRNVLVPVVHLVVHLVVQGVFVSGRCPLCWSKASVFAVDARLVAWCEH